MPKDSVYIDSCTWIAQYKPTEKLTDEQRAGLQSLYEKVDKGQVLVVGSTLIYVEALTVTTPVIKAAFDGKKGLLVAADEGIGIRARALQQACYDKTGRLLSNYDAVHLATASAMRCQRFITLDKVVKEKQLAPLKHKAVIEPILGLRIIDPSELDEQQRFNFPADGQG